MTTAIEPAEPLRHRLRASHRFALAYQPINTVRCGPHGRTPEVLDVRLDRCCFDRSCDDVCDE